MKNTCYTLFFVGLLGLFSCSQNSEYLSEVTVVVKNSSGATVAGCQVNAVKDNMQAVVGGTTDHKGEFRFHYTGEYVVSLNIYAVTINQYGTSMISLEPGEDPTVEITLFP